MSENKINLMVGADMSELDSQFKFLRDNLTQSEAKGKSAFQQLQNSIRATEKDYKSLVLTQGLSADATLDAANKLNELRNAQASLNAVTAQAGAGMAANNTIVQNAAGKFNSLGNSVNQIAREMPAFVNSAQTGFMAISNNLGPLVDSIKTFRLEQAAVVAGGGQAQSLFSALTSSSMLLNVGISAGITALTIFGPKLWEMVTATEELEGANKELAKSYEDITKAVEDYLMTDKERAAFNENTKFEEHKLAVSKELESLQIIENIRKVQGERLSQEEIQRRIKLQGQLQKLEVTHQQNLNKINERYKPKQSKTQVEENIRFEFPSEEIASKIGGPVQMLTDKLSQMKAVGMDAFVGVQGSMNNFAIAMDGIKDFLISNAQIIASAFANMAYQVGNDLAGGNLDLGKAALQMLSTIASALGQGMIAMSIPLILGGVTAPQGLALAAGGAAMMLLAGAMKAGSAPTQQGGSNGGGYTAGNTNLTMPNFSTNGLMIDVNGVVQGNNIIISNQNQIRQNRRVR